MGACVYCLQEFPDNELTVDHVIARSWYPKNTPPIEKWKAPSCGPCNNKLSGDENIVLERIAWCLDPKDPSLIDIINRARRAVDPKKGKSARDIKHRFNKKQALIRGIKDIHTPNAPGLLPSYRDNFLQGSRTGIMIPAGKLSNVVTKWVRGIYYCELGRPVPEIAEVSAQFVEDEVAREAFNEILKHAKHLQRGPGVEALFWHVEEGEQAVTQYAFNIWKGFRAYGTVEVNLD